MKKIISLLAACTFILCPLVSCDREDDIISESEYKEGYTYNQEEFTPDKGQLNNDKQAIEELTDVFNVYFRGTNNDNAKVELTAYTPSAYVKKLKDENKYQNYLLSVDTLLTQEKAQWSEYGDGAMLRLNEVTKIFTLNDAFLPKAENYFRTNFSEFDFDFEIEQVCEVYFRYTLAGSKGSDTSDSTVCAAKIKDDGWKLIFASSSELANS